MDNIEMTAGERSLLQWFVDGGGIAQYGECNGGPLDDLIARGYVTVAGDEQGAIPDFITKGSDLMRRPVSITAEGRAALKLAAQ